MSTPTMVEQPFIVSKSAWEYRDFIYQKWQPDQVWICLNGSDPSTAAYARSFLWETVRGDVIPELGRLLREGWEPTEEVGPSALHLRATQASGPCVNASDIALWLLTAGVALVVRLFLGSSPRVYAVYRPDEFHIQVRRPKLDICEAH